MSDYLERVLRGFKTLSVIQFWSRDVKSAIYFYGSINWWLGIALGSAATAAILHYVG